MSGQGSWYERRAQLASAYHAAEDWMVKRLSHLEEQVTPEMIDKVAAGLRDAMAQHVVTVEQTVTILRILELRDVLAKIHEYTDPHRG
jgi:hypothetical protein